MTCVLAALLLLATLGCEKTIKEVRSPAPSDKLASK
jgi:hypothetical protein